MQVQDAFVCSEKGVYDQVQLDWIFAREWVKIWEMGFTYNSMDETIPHYHIIKDYERASRACVFVFNSF